MDILNAILNIIFPVHCISCGKSGCDLCIKCLGNCPPAGRKTAEWIFPLFDYRHPPVKKSIWLLKYKSGRRLGSVFAEVLYKKILKELPKLNKLENFIEPILIPIPVAQKRRRERGFNQAELICKHLMKLHKKSNRNGADWTLEKDVLIKPKETEHQAKIEDRAKRLKNIIGSFAVKNEKKIRGKNIILIDDVATTGATLNEARKILKQAGARQVIAFTVAH